MQARIHTAVWYMYREEKIQSHIYRYTVQVPYSIWSLNICMGLYFLFPVRDASSQVDSTHNVVFIVERIYRKWSLYENFTYWIFFYPTCYPIGYYSNGIFRTWSLWVFATWSFPLSGFNFPSIHAFLPTKTVMLIMERTFWILTIPAYCSWDFQNLDLSGILAVVFTDNYFGYWLDVFFTEISQFFWFLAGCYFYGVPILWIQFGRFLLWLHSGFWVLYRVAP